jgi:alcohol dehydrogenase class IV
VTIHTYAFPTTIHFGPGARTRLGPTLELAGVERPLLVTDEAVGRLDFFEAIAADLNEQGFSVGVWDGGGGNPVRSQVTRGVEAFDSHEADGIVAIGGGAPMDVAKAIALMIHHPGDLFDYEDGLPDARPVDRDIPPLVAVPTTAGTGSEVGRSAVVSTDETHAKKIIFSPRLLPLAAIADPELTIGLPPGPTAATGMDALTHNVEAFLARGFHPMADGIALEAMRMIARSLRTAYSDPQDVDARGDMLLASLMGAVAFQKGLGATHSLAHALSTVCDLHHGLANGIMLPHVMAFYADAVPERFHRMAHAVGAKSEDADGFGVWLQELSDAIDIPSSLSEVGVTESHLEDLVHWAWQDVCHPLGPRPTTREDLRQLYEQAL